MHIVNPSIKVLICCSLSLYTFGTVFDWQLFCVSRALHLVVGGFFFLFFLYCLSLLVLLRLCFWPLAWLRARLYLIPSPLEFRSNRGCSSPLFWGGVVLGYRNLDASSSSRWKLLSQRAHEYLPETQWRCKSESKMQTVCPSLFSFGLISIKKQDNIMFCAFL